MNRKELRNAIYKTTNSPQAQVVEYLMLLHQDLQSMQINDLRSDAGKNLALELNGVLLRQDYVDWESDEMLAELQYLVIPLEISPDDLSRWRRVEAQLAIIGSIRADSNVEEPPRAR